MATSWGPWQNISQIGEGGSGHVFKAKHKETGELSALKRLKNTNRSERFRKEIEAVMRLKHPGIVPLLDADLDADPPYAVFEFEPGGSLADVPVDELLAMPIGNRLELCEQVCVALQAAHEAGIYHRDVKPENILLSFDRKTARLCDFGLVYFVDGERHTATMEQVGSRFFIPPELEDGRGDDVSDRSDVYCMGKVVYYILTGKIFARERHREERYDLTKTLKDPYLEAISQILDTAITDGPGSRCSIALMRTELHMARESIALRRPIQGVPATYRCIFCGVGTYKSICVSGEGHNEGYEGEGHIGMQDMVFLECDNCGNCQRFKLKYAGDRWFAQEHKRFQKRHQ